MYQARLLLRTYVTVGALRLCAEKVSAAAATKIAKSSRLFCERLLGIGGRGRRRRQVKTSCKLSQISYQLGHRALDATVPYHARQHIRPMQS
jgi:hypothetical protein